MLKFLVFTCLLALASSHDLQYLEGTWTGIKIYPEGPAISQCKSVRFGASSGRCDCDTGREGVIFNFDGHEVLVVNARDRASVMAALKAKCYRDETFVPHVVTRKLTENYVLIYARGSGPVITVLMGRQMPSESELEQLEQADEDLRSRRGTTLCVRGVRALPDLETHPDSPQWISYFKNHTSISLPSNDV